MMKKEISEHESILHAGENAPGWDKEWTKYHSHDAQDSSGRLRART